MKISNDKLALFKDKAELENYLKVNGISGSAASDHIATWEKVKSKRAVPKAKKKTTMVVTETDDSVEIK